MKREARAGGRGGRGPGPVQRERSAETREKVIRAAIACIAEEGFRRATTTRIAERAGISRGALQHQFGERGTILAAVLERVLQEFHGRLAGFTTRATSLEARGRALVEASWNLVREHTYRAYREILLHHPVPGAESIAPEQLMEQITAAIEEIVFELFADLDPSRTTVDLMSAVLFATLNGMAEQRRFAHFSDSFTRRQLSVLRETILRVLRQQTGSASAIR